METGFFQLKNAKDLFEKLQWEYENLVSHPGNAWRAFNFFVTAEHMADWKDCKLLKTTDPLLALCSHIANGGKHFEKLHKKHKLVAAFPILSSPIPLVFLGPRRKEPVNPGLLD